MNKIKIASIMTVAMLIGMGATSICGAVEITDGDIKVEVKEWIGLVYPTINIENQTNTPIQVTRTLNDTNYTNIVNDSLVIKLSITDNSGRSGVPFLLPRTMFYMVVFVREGQPIMPILSFFKRLMPVKAFGSVKVTNSTLGSRDTNITIPLKYGISNDTFNQGENITVKIFAMGMLPGTVDGVSSKVPLIAKAEFSLLSIDYQQKELIVE